MTDWKKSFLESSVLGQSTNKCCPPEVIIKCIELAYSDMMTAGRYYSASFLNDKKEICSATNSAITESNFVFSRKIIKDISLLFCDNTICSGAKLMSKMSHNSCQSIFMHINRNSPEKFSGL